MDPHMAAGWIGLVGASVGAAGALLGGWFQQRWQVRSARAERQEGYSRKAGETALDALVQMQQAVFAYVRDHSGEDGAGHKAEVVDQVAGLAHVARSQIMLITNAAETRDRLNEVLRVLIDYTAAQGRPRWKAHNAWFLGASQEGADLLSAFMRDEPIPERSEGFVKQMSHCGQDGR